MHRRGFTLIELLVSIAIIATLIGILLPALGAARAEGRRVACLANLRSIGQATILYRDDFENSLPFASSERGTQRPGQTPPPPFDDQGREGVARLLAEVDYLQGYLDYWSAPRSLASYIDGPAHEYEPGDGWSDVAPWTCPSDNGLITTPPTWYSQYMTSYSYVPGITMSTFLTLGFKVEGRLIGDVWDAWVPNDPLDGRPRVYQLPIFADGCINESTPENPKDWHNGGTPYDQGAQAVFLDGSADWNPLDSADLDEDGAVYTIIQEVLRRAAGGLGIGGTPG